MYIIPNHFILAKIISVNGKQAWPPTLWEPATNPPRALSKDEAAKAVDGFRVANHLARRVKYVYRVVPDSELHKYLSRPKMIDIREQAACPACQTGRAHNDVEWQRHPFAKHGYTKEQGWTHPLLAEATKFESPMTAEED